MKRVMAVGVLSMLLILLAPSSHALQLHYYDEFRGDIWAYDGEIIYFSDTASGWYRISGLPFWDGVPPLVQACAMIKLSLAPWFFSVNLTEVRTVETVPRSGVYYVEGYWDVYNVTIFDEPGNITISIDLYKEGKFGSINTSTEYYQISIEEMGLIECMPVLTLASEGGPEQTIPDVNGDGDIDVFDLVEVGNAYGSSPGRVNYDFFADVKVDWRIDIFDLVTVAQKIM